MQLPKSLLPTTEKEILKEISEELKIPLWDVKKSFNIWVDFLEDISLNTDQTMIWFTGFGKMYLSYHRAREAEDKEWAKMKIDRIEKEMADKKNGHKLISPLHIQYGVGRKNYSIGRDWNRTHSFFTKEECIRRQNIIFFKEDRDFSDRKDIFEEYFNDIPKQKRHTDYEIPKNNKSKTERQDKIERCKVVRREKIRMQFLSNELEK